MTIWQILTGRLKKYENLANFDNETEKSMKIWLVRFYQIFILSVMCMRDFHIYQNFILFLGGGGVGMLGRMGGGGISESVAGPTF